MEFLLFSYKRLCTAVFGIRDTRQIKFLPTVREGNVFTGVCLSTGVSPLERDPLLEEDPLDRTPGGRLPGTDRK